MTDAVNSRMPGDRGISPLGPRPPYATYHSPYAPNYKIQPNFHGIDTTRLRRFGYAAGLFGSVGIFGLLYFTSDVPRVRIDIMQKVPIIGPYFIHETPPEDNPF